MDKHNVILGYEHRRLGKQQRRRIVACWLALLMLSFVPFHKARAEVFESKFLRFRLPDGWKCNLEDQVFICHPPLPKGHKWPTIIVLSAKIASERDTLPDFMAHLGGNLSKTKGSSSLVDGPRINNSLGNISWVEATHLGSELDDFYTTYLATTSDGLSVLVTFSAHKSAFPKFRDMIKPCIQTLQFKSDWKKHMSTK